MESVQGRIVLVGELFKRGMGEFGRRCREGGLAAPRPEEKERLLQAVEHGVWALPDAFFEDAQDDGWEERAAADPRVRALVDEALGAILGARQPSSS